MSIIGGFILPHPPLIVPEVGRGQEDKIGATVAAYQSVSKEIARLKPDTLIITTPHSAMYTDYFHISPGSRAMGDFRRFGAANVRVETDYDQDLASAISARASELGIPAGPMGEMDPSLDHGSAIPLYFISQEYSGFQTVRIGLSGLPFADHYRLGQVIASRCEKLGRRAVLAASGDLSHKLLSQGPYGYAEEGVLFDRQITSAMKTGDFLRFLTFSPSFAESAAECGLRSFIILAGALDGVSVSPDLLSYEGPYGVGYAVASFLPGEADPQRRFLEVFQAAREEGRRQAGADESPFVRLARQAVESYVETGQRAKPPKDLPPELLESRAGVFVTIYKQGQLRGCIGTIAPTTDSVAQETLQNAVSSAARDSRFPPVTKEELEDLRYSVDVLMPPEPISSLDMLDTDRYGVIVSAGARRGLLLPMLEGVDSPEAQVRIARQKGGIAEDEPYSLQRFEVVRHQ